MKLKKLISICISICTLTLMLSGLTAVSAESSTLHLLGDSLCATYKTEYQLYPQQGWGAYISNFVKPNLNVINYSIGGASTKNYKRMNEYGELDTGVYVWDSFCNNLKQGDYVIINWLWNDANGTNDINIGTTEDEYKANLQWYINYIKGRGATPILMSSVCGFYLEDDTKDAYCQSAKVRVYAGDMREVAYANGVDFIDLNAVLVRSWRRGVVGNFSQMKVIESYNKYGISSSAVSSQLAKHGGTQGNKLTAAVDEDRTHLVADGAAFVANTVAMLIKQSNCALKQYIK